MTMLYNNNAPKKPTNLTVNSDLLEKAKEMKINISAILETALIEKLKETKQAEWLEANKSAIDNYNEHIQKIGLFSDEIRTF